MHSNRAAKHLASVISGTTEVNFSLTLDSSLTLYVNTIRGKMPIRSARVQTSIVTSKFLDSITRQCVNGSLPLNEKWNVAGNIHEKLHAVFASVLNASHKPFKKHTPTPQWSGQEGAG